MSKNITYVQLRRKCNPEEMDGLKAGRAALGMGMTKRPGRFKESFYLPPPKLPGHPWVSLDQFQQEACLAKKSSVGSWHALLLYCPNWTGPHANPPPNCPPPDRWGTRELLVHMRSLWPFALVAPSTWQWHGFWTTGTGLTAAHCEICCKLKHIHVHNIFNLYHFHRCLCTSSM